jgi:hypothetical protein
LSGNDTFTVTVNNMAPTVQAWSDWTTIQGQATHLTTAWYNDLGTLDTHTATIDWGDGTPLDSGECNETPFGPPGAFSGMDGSVHGSHTYASAGVYTVVVTVADDDGGLGQDTFAVTVQDDIDADGIASVEEQGPAGQDSSYDGNADGMPDAQQGNVASFHTRTGDYVTLACPQGMSLKNVSAIANPSPMDMPWEVGVPYGFLGFQVMDLTVGGAVTVDIHVPVGSMVNSYYKYGPTPDNPTPHWYEFNFDGTTGAVVEGNVIHLYLVDGLRGDDDLIANGIVVVVGAPAEVNHPPDVDLANAMTALAENTDTGSRIKVADIAVTDDAFGINALSLSGPDAGLFEIDGGVLYLKVGAALDHETHPQLEATVAVDDAGVGTSPDAAVSLSIGVTDVNEPPTQPTCVSPADAATGVTLMPILEGSAFSDPDAGDTHAVTQWQVDDDSDFSSPVWDFSDTDSDKTSQAVPSGTLSYSATYYWRMRYRDSQGAWSEWSDARSFTVDRYSAVYRFWKALDNTHFYTISEGERDKLRNDYADVYTYEGVAYYAYVKDQPPAGTLPVYRFWKASDNTHFYTIKEGEKQKLIDNFSHIYAYEGPAFYAYSTAAHPIDMRPVYRFWKASDNTHFYTIREGEKDKLINLFSSVYTFEDAMWYAYAG